MSPNALALIQDPNHFIYLSVVSVWEILIKQQLGKLSATMPLPQRITQQQANGLLILPVTLEHVMAVELLPVAHKDPFDRLLVAQTIVEGAILLSADTVFSLYPAKVVW